MKLSLPFFNPLDLLEEILFAPPPFAGCAPHAYLLMLGCSRVTVSSDQKAPGEEEVALALVMTRKVLL